MGEVPQRKDMERNKAAHLPAVLQLRSNRLHRGRIQWQRSHTHNYTRLGDEHNKIRICLPAPRHNGKTMRTKTYQQIEAQARSILSQLAKTPRDNERRLKVLYLKNTYTYRIPFYLGFNSATSREEFNKMINTPVPASVYAKQV